MNTLVYDIHSSRLERLELTFKHGLSNNNFCVIKFFASNKNSILLSLTKPAHVCVGLFVRFFLSVIYTMLELASGLPSL